MPPLPLPTVTMFDTSQPSQTSCDLPTTAAPPLPPRHCEHPEPSTQISANVTQAALSVTLTPAQNPSDERTISLNAYNPVLIGRASRSRDKNLQPSATNGLFDCPVVSRYHAELELVRRGPSLDDVIIRDIGSMHGTKINNKSIEEGAEITLKSGDRIKLGEKVTRGEGKQLHRTPSISIKSTLIPFTGEHDGVELTYYKPVSRTTQDSHTLAASQITGTGTFKVPTFTDDEEDDSDDRSVGSLSDHKHSSSAKTTPEQITAKMDSQNMPPTTNFDDDDSYSMSARASAPGAWRSSFSNSQQQPLVQDSHRVIPDTYDDDFSNYAPVSPGGAIRAEASQVAADNYHSDDYDHDDLSDDVDFDREADHLDCHPSDDESDYSCGGHGYDDEEDDNEGEDEPSAKVASPAASVQSSRNRPSPPAIITNGSLFPATSLSHHFADYDTYGSQPRYDPVRAAQSNSHETANTSASQGRFPTFKCAPPSAAYSFNHPGAYTDAYNSSRWDVPPPSFGTYVPQSVAYGMYPPPSAYEAQQAQPTLAAVGGPITGPPGSVIRPNKSVFSPNTPEWYTTFEPNVFGHRFHEPRSFENIFSTAPSQPAPIVPQKAAQALETIAPSMTKGFNIADIVEGASNVNTTTRPRTQSFADKVRAEVRAAADKLVANRAEAEATVALAQDQPKAPAQPQATPTTVAKAVEQACDMMVAAANDAVTSGKKRKASEMLTVSTNLTSNTSEQANASTTSSPDDNYIDPYYNSGENTPSDYVKSSYNGSPDSEYANYANVDLDGPGSQQVTPTESFAEADIAPPPAKRVKLDVPAHRSSIGTAAKIFGAAAGTFVAGGAATMAFLCSPLAERAIEWLA